MGSVYFGRRALKRQERFRREKKDNNVSSEHLMQEEIQNNKHEPEHRCDASPLLFEIEETSQPHLFES